MEMFRGKMGLAGDARSACVNFKLSSAYVRAARVRLDVAFVSKVVYDICSAVAAEKAVDGIPSRAASVAAPLHDSCMNGRKTRNA